MDIYKELADLLIRCSKTEDYYNPWLLQDLIGILEDHDSRLLEESVHEWVHSMWSR